MYTNKPIRIHSKCLLILEMIQKVSNRIAETESNIYLYDNAKWYNNIRLFNKRVDFTDRLEHLKKVKARLINYYRNTLEQLNKAQSKKVVNCVTIAESVLN